MRRITVTTSTQVDPAKALVGSSPFGGDMSNTGIVLPATPTPSQFRRYLSRLCGAGIDRDEVAFVRSIEQLLTIGAYELVGDPEEDPTRYPLELEVTSPTWSFIDGNVSWHLRHVSPQDRAPRTLWDDFPLAPPFIMDSQGTSAGILARIPVDGAYLPLANGIPYGEPVADLGTFRDIRFPWNQRFQDLSIEVPGPGTLVLFASVHQTNPDTRVQPNVAVDGTYLRREDRFVLNHPTARYWRVGARMILDVYHRSETF